MTKDFDCLEMKREGAQLVYEELKNMTPEQRRAYWKKGHEELLRLKAEARKALELKMIE